jgi:hypothetical protein
VPNRSFNLFTKDSVRLALSNQVKEVWQEVPFIVFSKLFPCCAEWLTGKTCCPDFAPVRYSCKSERIAPTADSSEEMALSKSHKVVCSYFGNATFIHYSIGYYAALY